jgi:4-amino-4-deoxy-L-arabinose transferase-like glycosyltransferase
MSHPKPCLPSWLTGAWPALLLAGSLGLCMLASRPLLPVDETRYLSVAWEMWLRGDFIVPHKNFAVYVDKPPLLFWLMHAGWAVLGVNAWWPRLIPTLAALASLLLTARLATALWPSAPRIARLAPWLLASMLLWQAFTGAVMFDTLLAMFALLALNALVAPPLGRARWAWFALGIGGGLLTKGPVILLHTLPAALTAPWWRPPSADRRQSDWWRWYGGLLLGVLGGAAILAAWLWPAIARAGASYGAGIGYHQTADRLVHSYSHRRPWWWYLQLAPALALPWTLWPPLYRGLGRLRGARDAGLRFCLTATVPAFVMFCLISGKQAHYLLPLLAPLALLGARAIDGASDAARPHDGWPLALLLGASALAMLLLPQALPQRAWLAQIPPYVPATLTAAALLLVAIGRQPVRSATCAAGLVFVLAFAGFYGGVMQALGPRYDLAAAAARVAQAQAAGAPVAYVGRYHAQLSFLGRLRHPLAELRGGQLADWVARHRNGYLVVECDGEPAPPAGVYQQPYRGGSLRLWPVARLGAAFDARALCGD